MTTTGVRLVSKILEKRAFIRRKLHQRPLTCLRGYTGKNIAYYTHAVDSQVHLSVYKNVNHRGGCAMFKLCKNTETNPWPLVLHVDSTLESQC